MFVMGNGKRVFGGEVLIVSWGKAVLYFFFFFRSGLSMSNSTVFPR